MNHAFARRFFRVLLLALACAWVAAPLARAEDAASVRARMAQRLPSIDALKLQGALGENNRGLLDVRAASAEASAVADAENRDRALVYAALAQKTGATPDAVARARARQIATASAPGLWLQRESGEWYQK